MSRYPTRPETIRQVRYLLDRAAERRRLVVDEPERADEHRNREKACNDTARLIMTQHRLTMKECAP